MTKDLRPLHLAKVGAAVILLETFLVGYPQVVEALIPNYYIHYEVWIPLGIALHAGLAVVAYKRWPGAPRPR